MDSNSHPQEKPFYVNRQHTEVRIELLNYYQDLHYQFACRGVQSVRCDLPTVECGNGLQFQDLYTYEITGFDKSIFQLGFLFASGGTIEIEFRKLVFRRRRVRRKYEVGEMYR